MAVMHPESIQGIPDIQQSEQKVFNAFQRLGDEWHVFHSVSWHNNREGECDFLVFHPAIGIAAIEVKGGGIRCHNNQWTSISRNGEVYKIKNPFDQARNSMTALIELYTRRYNTFPFKYCWGVCFPDTDWVAEYDTLNLNPTNVLDLKALDNPQAWLERLFRSHGHRKDFRDINDQDMEQITSFIGQDLFVPLSIKRLLREHAQAMERINYFQDYMLDLFEDKKKIGFQGAAGTGKTWIAIKKARRLAAQKKRVLFLCFNKQVMELIQDQLQSVTLVNACTFHSFARDAIRTCLLHLLPEAGETGAYRKLIHDLFELGVPEEKRREPKEHKEKTWETRLSGHISMFRGFSPGMDYKSVFLKYRAQVPDPVLDALSFLAPGPNDSEANYHSERIPLALLALMEGVGDELDSLKYDAVLVDEAQDFDENWCACLTRLFDKYRSRIVYIFYDDNQTIFSQRKDLPIKDLIAKSGLGNHIFQLRDNLRNSRNIHQFAIDQSGLGGTAHSLDIPGVDPETISVTDPDAAFTWIHDKLDELLNVHHIEQKNIIVLSNRSMEHSIFSEQNKLGEFTLVKSGAGKRANSIRYRTIFKYKGREADVVFLIIHRREMDKQEDRYLADETLYVGYTRARHLLYVVEIEE